MSMLTSMRCAALLAFACGVVLYGGTSYAATPAGAAALAALGRPAPPMPRPLTEATPVSIAEEDVDDEGEGDNDNAEGGQRATLAPTVAGRAGAGLFAEDETDDDADDTDESSDDFERV